MGSPMCAEEGCAAPVADTDEHRCAGPTGAGCERLFCLDHIYVTTHDGRLCSADYDGVEHRDDVEGFDG